MTRLSFHYTGRPVRSLQTMLRALSFRYPFLPRLKPDGIFGEATLEAVMRFQRTFLPPVTGRVDQRTWDAISALYRQTLPLLVPPLPARGWPGGLTVSPGQESIHLALAQTMFQSLSQRLTGLESTPASGVLDKATQNNLLWLQRAGGQEQTGALDQVSWNTLSRLYTLFVTNQRSGWLPRADLFPPASVNPEQ